MWRAVFLLTFKPDACTKEYEASHAQGIVLEFLFLQGCLGNQEALPLEVCETPGTKKQTTPASLIPLPGQPRLALDPLG